MKIDLRFAAMLALSGLLLTSCSLVQSRQTAPGSSSTGDQRSREGPCKNVDICTVIPQSEVNRVLGVVALNAVPDEPTNSGGLTSDHCAYLNAKDNTNVQLLRQCYPKADEALNMYISSKQAYLARGGTRTDLSGVGEKAFYEVVPGQSEPKARLIAIKGKVYVILSDASVPSGQEALIQQGLTSFANTLLSK